MHSVERVRVKRSAGGWFGRRSAAVLFWYLTALAVAAQVLPGPSQVAASKGTYPGGVRIWWTPVAGAGAYDIWRSTMPDRQTANYLSSVGGSKSEYIDSSIPPNTSYYYWVRTVTAPGVSSDFGYWHEGYWVPGPPPPVNVQASDGLFSHRILVTWDASPSATSYQVWRHTENDRHAAGLLATTSSTQYNDTAIDPLQVYYYWVKAVNADGISGFSWANPGYAKPEPPGQVANVQASQGHSLEHIRVAWDAAPGGQYYEIWRSEQPQLWTGTRVAAQVTGTEFLDAAVPPRTVFTYWVRAVNALGYGAFSEPGSGYREAALPGKPLHVTASKGMYSGGIHIAWQESAHAMAYEILRNVVRDLPSATVRATVPAGPDWLEYWDAAVPAGVVHFYWIRPLNNAGAGVTSWSAEGYRSAGPDAPTYVQASDGTIAGAVRVTWLAPAGAAGYQVWRNEVKDTRDAVMLGSVAGTEFLDTTALPGTLYYYWVKAMNVLGTSGFSWSASGYPQGPEPVIRKIILPTMEAHEEQVLHVPIFLRSRGDENALAFSVQFDPAGLEFRGLALGGGLPAGTMFLPNLGEAALGRVGCAMALPPGTAPAGGSEIEVARMELAVLGGPGDRFEGLWFSDLPVAREIVSVSAGRLAAEWKNGGLLIAAPPAGGVEADVSPAPDGDGAVTLQDWVQIGRYVAGLDPVPPALFQRADCAPRATLGDGRLTLEDWVQAGRYAQGLDPLTEAGGPVAPIEPAASALGMLSMTDPPASPPSARIHIAPGCLRERPRAAVVLASEGQVNALSFTVSFEAGTLDYQGITPGPEIEAAGGLFLVNSLQAGQGRLGILVAMPPGETLPAGLRTLAELHIAQVDPGRTEPYPLHLGNEVIARAAVGTEAQSLDAVFESGWLRSDEDGGTPGPPEPLRLRAAPRDDSGGMAFTWSSRPGRTYRLEWSPDLAQWHALVRVTGQESSTAYQARLEELMDGRPQGFLRIVEEP